MEPAFPSWTVTQLRQHLRELGLKVSGNKDELIQRIQRTSPDNYSKFTVPKLKQLLKERNLSLSGRKADLVKRLEDEARSPPKTSLADIPPEVMIQVLLNLNDKDLATFSCRTYKRAAEVVADDSFWNDRIKHIFDYNLSKYKIQDLSYRDMYKFFIKHQNLGIIQTMHEAINAHYLPLLKYIIEVIQPSLGIVGINRALVTAASIGDVDIISYLINKYDASDLPGAVLKSAKFGHLDSVKYLVEYVEMGTPELTEALLEAVNGRNRAVADYLLDELIYDPNRDDEDDIIIVKYVDGHWI